MRTATMRINYPDLTIFIHVQLDDIERLENVLEVSRYVSSNFGANIRIAEYASYNNGMLEKLIEEDIQYFFHEYYEPAICRYRLFDQLIRTATTPFVAIWSSDVIIPASQLWEVMEMMKNNEADFVIPYQEPRVDSVLNLKSLYRQRNSIERLYPDFETKREQYPEGILSEIVIANRENCLSSGFKKENFCGWCTKDYRKHFLERNMNIKMRSIPGMIFRLEHGRCRRLGKLILHFNTPELTEQLCRMVPDAIVIDNGSTEHPYCGKNRCIRQENFGFTEGWNRAVKTLWTEFDMFWLMNSDIVIDPESVKRVEWIAATSLDVLFFTPAYNCWMKHCTPIPNEGLIEVPLMEFTAPVISRKVFEIIGFFDKLFAKGYGVDFDFCYRARQKGLKMYVDHKSSFYHLGHQTIAKHEGILQYSQEANREMENGLVSKYGPEYKSLIFEDVL